MKRNMTYLRFGSGKITNHIQNFITWLYIKYVFLPDLKEIQEKSDDWHDIRQAMDDKRFNTLQ